MGNITLTKILFVALISTFMITALFGAYSEFAFYNNASIEEKYQHAFENISGEYSNFDGLATTNSDRGIVTGILDFGRNALTGTVNVFIVGLDAIGAFFDMGTNIESILHTIEDVFPHFKALMGLLITILLLYIAMRYIQSASNKSDLP